MGSPRAVGLTFCDRYEGCNDSRPRYLLAAATSFTRLRLASCESASTIGRMTSVQNCKASDPHTPPERRFGVVRTRPRWV